VHVPLVVKPPAGSGIPSGRRREPVETAAVAPSLLQVARVKDWIERQFQSNGLFGKDAVNRKPAYSETFYPFSSFGWSPLHALQTDRYHYIDAPAPELYDVVADPEERNNLAEQQTATMGVLKDKLQQTLKNNPFTRDKAQDSGVNPDTIERLRALGYVAYRAPVSDAALAAGLPDPKTKLWEFLSILKATDLLFVGEYATGEELLNQVREKDPKIYIVPFMLGEGALRQQKWEEAAKQLRLCLELNPNFDQAMTALAHALTKLENRTEARTWIERALRYNPQNYRAWYELGSIEAKTNRVAAISALEKAVSIQPNFPLLLRDLGVLQFQEKNYKGAAKHLAKAVELGVDEATIHNFLGICYSQTNQLRKGIASYKRALEVDPDLAEAHLNLGFAYQQSGRLQAAHEHYLKACHLNQKFCQHVPEEKQ
jgi:tetratricopeptide (TPR) repeat protein